MTMNVMDAAFNLVNDYPGGAASLAPRITSRDKVNGDLVSKSASTLAHEVRGQGSAKLGLADAVKMTDLADDNGILLAWARHRNLAVYPLPDGLDPDSLTSQHVTTLLHKLGAVVTTVVEADADGIITLNELRDAERKWNELCACGMAMLRLLTRKHEAGKPVDMPNIEGGGL